MSEPATAPTPDSQQLLAREKRWLVDQGDHIGGLAGDKKEWKSQINGLAEAASNETEPRVLLNLLRYQQARNDGAWSGVADPLFDDMVECVRKAGDDAELAVLLIRHLLLYSSRSYTYNSWLKKSGNGNGHGSQEVRP